MLVGAGGRVLRAHRRASAVLDAVRLGPEDDATAVTATQLRAVVERLARVDQWRTGDQEMLVVMDAGYDVTRLAWLLRDLPVEITKMCNPLRAEGRVGQTLLPVWIAKESLRNLLVLARTGASRHHVGHAHGKFFAWSADSNIPLSFHRIGSSEVGHELRRRSPSVATGSGSNTATGTIRASQCPSVTAAAGP